jgi:hypothetical protein
MPNRPVLEKPERRKLPGRSGEPLAKILDRREEMTQVLHPSLDPINTQV